MLYFAVSIMCKKNSSLSNRGCSYTIACKHNAHVNIYKTRYAVINVPSFKILCRRDESERTERATEGIFNYLALVYVYTRAHVTIKT